MITPGLARSYFLLFVILLLLIKMLPAWGEMHPIFGFGH